MLIKFHNNPLLQNQNQNQNQKNILVKFCIFAGRQKNMLIVHQYIKTLLQEKIIHEYHIFDFSRNINDKTYLYESYLTLKSQFINQIFIHNHENTNNTQNNQTDWSPFYKTISKSSFYQDSIIIKCDDDILFIDINGLKNAIKQRKNDKKSFLIHSNCINNNICSYYQRNNFPSLTEKLNIYPKGGICGPIFENPVFAYIMQQQFLNYLNKDLNNLYQYYLQDIYVHSRISINFILINGNDCKYFKHTSLNDEYELSSYYPEKLSRPNKIIGNFITCHYSYSLQEKVMMKKNELLNYYQQLALKYNSEYKRLNYIYENKSMNKIINYKLSKNKFYRRNFNYQKYSIFDSDYYLFMNYEDNQLGIHENNKNYFDILFIEPHKIIIQLGIYKLNPYNLKYDLKNRNIFTKYFHQDSECIIELIPCENKYYFMFLKAKVYMNILNQKIVLEKEPKTLWNFKQHTSKKKVYYKRFSKNKKLYYKNLENDELFSAFYLGWTI